VGRATYIFKWALTLIGVGATGPCSHRLSAEPSYLLCTIVVKAHLALIQNENEMG
jgi:hypothetical protein